MDRNLDFPKLSTPWWFKAWVAFCALLGLAVLGGLGLLVYALIQWLDRH